MNEAQNGCHGNTGCLATGQRNLHSMIGYLKNMKDYKPSVMKQGGRFRGTPNNDVNC